MDEKRKTGPVAAVVCESYDRAAVRRAMQEVLEPLGGIGRFVRPGMTAAVKVNLISGMSPDKAATTHPAVAAEFCRMLIEAGAAHVIIGDSPGGSFTPAHLRACYDQAGLNSMVRELNEEPALSGRVTLNTDTTVRHASYPEGKVLRAFSYTAWLDQADGIFNLCKLKTHGMLKMTCAVKNLFGVIPGLVKPEYHGRFPSEDAFADMLVDLNEYFRPALTLCDAVVGMEGNGPTQGKPRRIGALLASASPYALDAAAGRLIGFSPKEIATGRRAQSRGLGPSSYAEVQILPDRRVIEALRVRDFDTNLRMQSILFGSGPLHGVTEFVMRKLFGQRPKVTPSMCVGCGRCRDLCPQHAITMRDAGGGQADRDGSPDGAGVIPVIDRGKCIRCFCCQEFCPVGAMRVSRAPAAVLLDRFNGRRAAGGKGAAKESGSERKKPGDADEGTGL